MMLLYAENNLDLEDRSWLYASISSNFNNNSMYFLLILSPSNRTILKEIYMSKLLDPNQMYGCKTMFDTKI